MVDGPLPADGDALFVPDGDRFVPTEWARGPWSPDALHGGPVAALVAREAERRAGDDGLQPVRLTLELLRPVGTGPLTVTAREVRPGRTVRIHDVVVAAGGAEVAWGRVLRLRVDPSGEAPRPTVPEDPPLPPPAAGTAVPFPGEDYPAFHNAGMEVRFVAGAFGQPGPAAAWFRLRPSVVPGEPPSPFQRTTAAGDFGNGIGAELAFGSAVFINPDLTVALHRLPVGEWVGLDARTRFGPPGIGMAESALLDVEGRIGRAVQTLVVDPAP